MSKFSQFFKNNTKKLIVGGVVAVFILIIIILTNVLRNSDDDTPEQISQERFVQTLVRGDDGFEARITASGTVTSEQEAIVRAETSGVITAAPVRVGDAVSRGALLAQFNNTDAQNAVSQARAARDAAAAQLRELERSADGGQSADILMSQQNTLVQNAYRNLLNTDLRAYPVDRAAETRANPPIISGTYTSFEEGEYIIETYASGALSGASFRISGLESGAQSINAFNNAVPLGTRGLSISFPQSNDVALSNQKWVVSIPNTQSSMYGQALSAYETAVQGRDVALNQGVASESRIASAQASLAQAEAALASAQNQLAKTSVRAPFAGDIISMQARLGDFVSMGSPIATIINNGELYVQSFISVQESRQVSIGDRVTINGSHNGRISHISSGINPQNGKIEIRITLDATDHDFISGEFVDVEITVQAQMGDSDIILLPLQAVQPQLQGTVLYRIKTDEEGHERVYATEIQTGSIIGEFIQILTPLPEDMVIAASARGLRDTMKVSTQ